MTTAHPTSYYLQHTCLLVVILLCHACLAGAATPTEPNAATQPAAAWYQLDVVVFRHRSATNTGEAWPAVKPHPLPANAMHLKQLTPPYTTVPSESLTDLPLPADNPPTNVIPATDSQQEAFTLLPETAQRLTTQATKLRKSSHYQLLAQLAWRLPMRAEEAGQPVVIASTLTADTRDFVRGTVTLSARKYLHVTVDLWYHELQPAATAAKQRAAIARPQLPMTGTLLKPSPDAAPLQIVNNFPLQESRRIQQTGEVHYLDSPVLGVLFKLTPYTSPQASTATLKEQEQVSADSRADRAQQ